jgi:hypothetical protein
MATVADIFGSVCDYRNKYSSWNQILPSGRAGQLCLFVSDLAMVEPLRPPRPAALPEGVGRGRVVDWQPPPSPPPRADGSIFRY